MLKDNKRADRSPHRYEDIKMVAEAIKSQLVKKQSPTVGIICGSGLGDLAEQLSDKQVVPYEKIPGFPVTHVAGHKGNLVFGNLGGKFVICVQGRFHPYEHNMDLALCAMPVRVMKVLGVKTMIVSNAAGGISPTLKEGDLMLIRDQIFIPGLAGFSPLVGPNDERFGARFPSVHAAYDPKLRSLAMDIAKAQSLRMEEGVYCMTAGPEYESPAEVTFLKSVGADALGMSTCHEVIVATQMGIKVLGFSLITNTADLNVSISKEVTHSEVLDVAAKAMAPTCKFVTEFVRRLSE
ncbi:hypothetical protein AB6A40_005065 [Gnathostoma spinigerum]|uniref:Purine nucleoside phosphorylase n=1 Tax=Gnathostoma spinigerum TaxID=75299 RepID=A0ABD6ELQ4_9BILA